MRVKAARGRISPREPQTLVRSTLYFLGRDSGGTMPLVR